MTATPPNPAAAGTFCARCASPVEDGLVLRGGEVYCSYECALAATPKNRILRIGARDTDPIAAQAQRLEREADGVLAEADAQPFNGSAQAPILPAENRM